MFEKEIILREQLRHGASSSVTRPKIAGQTVARWIVEGLPVIHLVRPPRVANGLSVRCFTHPLTTFALRISSKKRASRQSSFLAVAQNNANRTTSSLHSNGGTTTSRERSGR